MMVLRWLVVVGIFAVAAFAVLRLIGAEGRVEAALSEIGRLEASRDSALAAIAEAEARAARWAAAADSLAELQQREQEAAAARARRLSSEADSLEAAISAMVPEGEVRASVERAVSELRDGYDIRIADLTGLLALSRSEVGSLRSLVVEQERLTANLRTALEVTTSQRDVCLDEIDPGWMDRLRRSAGWFAGAVATGIVIGVAIF